jgi:ribose transport system substrate-binding protein
MKTICAAVVSALLVSAAIAGCSSAASSGGGDASSGGTSTASSGSASTAACVATARTALTAAEQSPKLGTVPALHGVAGLRGKSVWFIGNLSLGITADQLVGIRAGLSAAGLKLTVFSGQSEAPQEIQGIQEAIAAHASAIIIGAVQTEQISPALGAAANAHIPVMSIYEKPVTAAADRAIKDVLGFDSTGSAKAIAAYAIVKNDCKVNAALMYRPVLSVSLELVTALKDYFNTTCPATCKFQAVQYDVTTQATSLGPLAVNTVDDNPSLNTMVIDGDDASDYAVDALKASDKSISVISQGGSAPGLSEVASKTSLFTADVANVPNQYVGWLASDTTLRMILGQPAVFTSIPTRLLTTDNIPASSGQYFDLGDYAKAFTTAWGVG